METPTPQVLESLPPPEATVPRQLPQQTVHRNVDSKNDQGIGSPRGDQKECHAAHASPFLRDRFARSGGGHPDNQPTAEARQHQNDDGLSARPPRSPASFAKPAGLAADSATAPVGGAEPKPARRLSVTELLKQNAGRFVQQHPKQAVPQVQSTLAKISLCRTAALGGRAYRCSGCDHQIIVANSCGDRYCPTCSGARRSDWLESTGDLIIDGVDHFQVVFTLPDSLSRLALGNRAVVYNLLFGSAWSALKQTIGAEHGYDAAALMVLHTWN